MKALTALAAALFAAITFLLITGPASATAPGENGRIAYRLFLDDAGTRIAIATIRPNGTDRKRVTHPSPGVVHLSPDWSPTGRWLIFIRAKGEGPSSPDRSDHPRIFRIRPNGTGKKNLSFGCTGTCVNDDDPAWSPNGKRIAFTRFFRDDHDQADLMIMRADGTHVHHLTRHPFGRNQDWAVQWSPNGKRLSFSRYNAPHDREAVFIVRRDGSGVRRVTPWHAELGPHYSDWSPNGRWIAFREEGIWLTHPNGEGRHRIADTSGGTVMWGQPSFSPDGTMITVGRTPGLGPPDSSDIFRFNIDGSNLFNVTQTTASEGAADWGPRR